MNIREIDEKYKSYKLKLEKCENCKKFNSNTDLFCIFDEDCFDFQHFELDKEKYINNLEREFHKYKYETDFVSYLLKKSKKILKLLEEK